MAVQSKTKIRNCASICSDQGPEHARAISEELTSMHLSRNATLRVPRTYNSKLG